MEDERHEFPEVIELCIGGTHNYTALRSTLTRDENSVLAAMFTGGQPVHKSKEGRYFLDVDGPTFKTVLEYLKFGTFPTLSTNRSSSGIFGGEQFLSYKNFDEVKAIYRTASSLKLGQLTEFLENCFPVYVDVKLEKYRTSTVGYFESLAQVLATIPPQSLLLQRHFSVRLVNNSDFKITPACCEHVCQYNEKTTTTAGFGGFGGQTVSSYSVDVVVKVAVEVDCTLLSFLCYDLAERGFDVQGRESSCYNVCSKRQNVFGGSVIRNTQCCRQELFILHFRWQLHTATVARQPGLTFGFGQQPVTGSCFGQAQITQSPQGFGFGSGPDQQGGGSSSFGFGQAQPTQSPHGGPGFTFGSVQQPTTGGLFGQVQTTQSQQGFGFGSGSSPQGSGSSSFGFGRQNPVAGFGQPQTTSSCFGAGKTREFSLSQNVAVSKGFGQSDPVDSVTQTATGTQKSGLFGTSQPGPFGTPAPKIFTGFGISSFGGTPKSASVFTDTKQETQKQTLPSASFGSPSPQMESLFGKSPTSSNVFGGKAVFHNPIGAQQVQPSSTFAGFGLVKSEVKESD
ncbi:uncharacterized protein LOC127833671 [Dreissena polymorpha]|uniref:Potassium channel tetramerisation-type BTB domain-containing protein n=1 Tax=Dreissena polymorpha TaxID=45954 RepID=A0A9D4FWR4_DREPO|nr:uncharacterized protein LOC127833671 [Dreissena polymorpha]KAH3806694.1 hypothetical protein DPMN_135018 [Dreissena polymorpha]